MGFSVCVQDYGNQLIVGFRTPAGPFVARTIFSNDTPGTVAIKLQDVVHFMGCDPVVQERMSSREAQARAGFALESNDPQQDEPK